MNSDQLEKNISELLVQEVAPKLLKFFIDSYSNEGSWKNGKFVGWKDRKYDTGLPILVASTRMKQSFGINYKSDIEFVLTNDALYASYHNEGNGQLPQRPILYDDKKVEEVLVIETEKALKLAEIKVEALIKRYLIGK